MFLYWFQECCSGWRWLPELVWAIGLLVEGWFQDPDDWSQVPFNWTGIGKSQSNEEDEYLKIIRASLLYCTFSTTYHICSSLNIWKHFQKSPSKTYHFHDEFWEVGTVWQTRIENWCHNHCEFLFYTNLKSSKTSITPSLLIPSSLSLRGYVLLFIFLYIILLTLTFMQNFDFMAHTHQS